MTHSQSATALKAAAVILELFGLFMILSVLPAFQPLLTPLLQLATLDSGATVPFGTAEGRFLAAVVGGVTVGLGAAIWMITTEVYATNPSKGARMLLVPTFSWFVADGLGSALAGAPFNIVLNLSFLALIVVPVWAARRRAAAV